MSAAGMLRTALAGAALCAAAPTAAAAQADLAARGGALAARVGEVRDGSVRMTFPLRPGVCGVGESVRVGRETRWIGNNWYGEFSGNTARGRDVEWEKECETGPGRVVLDVSGGSVQHVRFYVGGRWRAADARVLDLGEVPADQAAGLLLRVAQGEGLRAEPGAQRAAIFPATLGANVEAWPALLGIAKDVQRPREARRQALFWLGVGAGEAATVGLTELVDDPDREVRVQAVYALSRRPADEGVPALIKVARTHKDPAMRRQAMHWLGRSEDPRAVALFEEILVAKR
ncbi:MAG: HEAT repeat domain-containing protein [Gemmatirosa sp.]